MEEGYGSTRLVQLCQYSLVSLARIRFFTGNVCYYHARTGRYSNISESEAAKRVQRIYRKKRQQVQYARSTTLGCVSLSNSIGVNRNSKLLRCSNWSEA